MANAQKLFTPVKLDDAASVLCTVKKNAKLKVEKIALYNSHATDAIIATIHLVPKGGTAGPTNIYAVKSVAAGTTESIDINQVLEADDTVQALAATADKVVIHGSGSYVW